MQKKTILFLGSQSLAQYQNFFKQFLEAASLSFSADYECKCLATDLELLKNLATPYLPHLVFLDGSLKSDRYSQKDLYQVADTLKKIDNKLMVLFISSELVGGAAQIQGIDQGVDAYLNWDLQPKKNFEMLREAVELGLHQQARRIRVPVRHKIRITLASFKQAIVAETLNVGTGGMFVRALPQNVQKGDSVDFEFLLGGALSQRISDDDAGNPLDKFEDHGTRALRGAGTVVWIRAQPQVGLPEGMGVEFVELEANTKELIEEYVRDHKIQSFIPNS